MRGGTRGGEGCGDLSSSLILIHHYHVHTHPPPSCSATHSPTTVMFSHTLTHQRHVHPHTHPPPSCSAIHSPTTVMFTAWSSVSKNGLSPITSHRKLPEVSFVTAVNATVDWELRAL